MTRKTPRRLTILHWAHMRRTLLRTFIVFFSGGACRSSGAARHDM